MAEQKADRQKIEVREVRGLKLFALCLLAQCAKLYYATMRYSIAEGDRQALCDCSKPSIVIIWHNRILTSPGLRHRFRPQTRLSAMISASRDGALITAFIGMLGIGARRGSSSRRAATVARELIGELRSGNDIAITPDGPRGPMYSFKEGAAVIALMSKAPVVLVCPDVKSGHRFNSWDGFYFAWPFSRVRVRSRRFTPEDLPRDREECAEFLRKAMIELTDDLPAPPRAKPFQPKSQEAS